MQQLVCPATLLPPLEGAPTGRLHTPLQPPIPTSRYLNPVNTTKIHLNSLREANISLILKRKPRLKMTKLQMAGCDGGLDVPNLRFYQLASHLWVIASWHKCDPASIWHDIDSSQSKCPLLNLLFMNNPESVKKNSALTYYSQYHQSLEIHSLYRRPGSVVISSHSDS